ncbi:MAG: pyridoxamine 5'-phosphate oxidase family protein [Dehalococcoidales bacterium]|nr:pyridoxamine 5'-phosphate oxidase family protein [Dehalococcoidales bacterium]
MDKKEILEFITANPISFMATVDGTAARVRGMDTFRADEKGLIFYTGKNKDVFKQLAKNPEIEACYYAKGTQVRVRGKVEIVEDEALKKEIVSKRPFLQPVYEKTSLDNMGVMRLKGKATTWTMQDVYNQPTWTDL